MDENVHEFDSPRNVRVDSERDEYSYNRFAWWDQVAADPELPASAFKVAYAIATSLWRSKGTVTLVSSQAGTADKVREALDWHPRDRRQDRHVALHGHEKRQSPCSRKGISKLIVGRRVAAIRTTTAWSEKVRQQTFRGVSKPKQKVRTVAF